MKAWFRNDSINKKVTSAEREGKAAEKATSAKKYMIQRTATAQRQMPPVPGKKAAIQQAGCCEGKERKRKDGERQGQDPLFYFLNL